MFLQTEIVFTGFHTYIKVVPCFAVCVLAGRCDGIDGYLAALRRLRGLEEPVRRPEDEFVVRKGVRVYLRDRPGLRARAALKDGRADGG